MLYDSSSISDSHHNGQICYVVSCVGVCMCAWEEKNFQILSTKHLTTTS